MPATNKPVMEQWNYPHPKHDSIAKLSKDVKATLKELDSSELDVYSAIMSITPDVETNQNVSHLLLLSIIEKLTKKVGSKNHLLKILTQENKKMKNMLVKSYNHLMTTETAVTPSTPIGTPLTPYASFRDTSLDLPKPRISVPTWNPVNANKILTPNPEWLPSYQSYQKQGINQNDNSSLSYRKKTKKVHIRAPSADYYDDNDGYPVSDGEVPSPTVRNMQPMALGPQRRSMSPPNYQKRNDTQFQAPVIQITEPRGSRRNRSQSIAPRILIPNGGHIGGAQNIGGIQSMGVPSMPIGGVQSVGTPNMGGMHSIGVTHNLMPMGQSSQDNYATVFAGNQYNRNHAPMHNMYNHM